MNHTLSWYSKKVKHWCNYSYSPNHKWGEPKIVSFDYNDQSGTFKQICVVCGCVRNGSFFYRNRLYIYPTNIIMYPKNYHETECYKIYKRLYSVGRSSKKKDKLQENRQRKKELAKIYREEQITKNLDILKKTFLQEWWEIDKVVTMRRNFAIYRLYIYLNYPIKEIANKAGISEVTIKKIISNIFAVLCMSSDSCVFKEQLKKMLRK